MRRAGRRFVQHALLVTVFCRHVGWGESVSLKLVGLEKNGGFTKA